MIVVAFDGRCRSLKANVIEAGKRSARDVFDCVIGHKEKLLFKVISRVKIVFLSISFCFCFSHLPTHKHYVGVFQLFVVKVVVVERFYIARECLKFTLLINFNANILTCFNSKYKRTKNIYPVSSVDLK